MSGTGETRGAAGGPGGGFRDAENIGHGATGHSPEERSDAAIAHFAFDDVSQADVNRAISKYPEGRQASAVMALLYAVQRQMRRTTGSAWVPRVAMDHVAGLLKMPPIRVYEVATFYLMYNTKPIGRHHLQVCTTTPCWLRGSDAIVETCRRVGGVPGFGLTSEDGLFTMTEVECLGACVNAPILQVDDDYYEDLDASRCADLLDSLRRGERPRPGTTIDRLNSAAAGGRTTLLETPAPGMAD